MKRVYLLSVLLAAAIFCSCSEDITEEATVGSIAGSVSDRTTGEPVATVNVSISPGGSSTVTGSDGAFSFRNLEEGSYTLTITKEGYKQNSQTVTVRPGDPTSAHLLIERIPAIVTADREVLDFGSNASTNTLSFNIVNPGYVDLEWEIENRCEWITEVKPAKGTLKYGKTEGIVVVIDRGELSEGNNEAVIVVRSSNGSSEVKVTAVGEAKKLPTLNVLEPTNISATTATLNGQIVTSGYPLYTERGFVYSTSSIPSSGVDASLPRVTAPISDKATFSTNIDGLTLGVSYYVRAYAVNSEGTAYSSNQVAFTTVAELATLTVEAATNVDVVTGEATLNGTVVTLGDPAYKERGFVYNTRTNPTVNHNKVVVNGVGTGKYSVDVVGLDIEQIYYVRAYALNEVGDVAYSSNEVTVSTKAILPQVTTMEIEAADLSAGTATLRGTIVSLGEPAYTERGFVYSTMPNPTIYDGTKLIANGKGVPGSFSINAAGLPTTEYYVRAYATNRGGTVYGEERRVGMKWVDLTAIGLSVQKEDIGYGTWQSVDAMCNNSTLGGYADWRLPNKDELMSLYTNKDYIGGFTTTKPTGSDSQTHYWSSSYHYSYYYSYYYYVSFYDGELDYNHDYYNKSGRCVRTIK